MFLCPWTSQQTLASPCQSFLLSPPKKFESESARVRPLLKAEVLQFDLECVQREGRWLLDGIPKLNLVPARFIEHSKILSFILLP